jgi:isoquinoline 1-oxidoreductase subunit beta
VKRAKKPPPTPEMRWRTTRRRFLIGTGTLGVLGVGAYFGIQEGRPLLVNRFENATLGANTPTKPDLWFEVKPDEGVTLFVPKGEMGQGVYSVIAQIAAEELELEVSQLKIQPADSTHGFGQGEHFTFGSTSVSGLFTPLRKAAASLRELLRLEAARQLNVPVSEVVALRGTCFNRQNPKSALTYGQVVAAKQSEWTDLETPPALKPAAQWTSVGRNTPRVDVRAKLTGQPVYGMDARVPDMLYGAVARAPRFGARLTGADEAAARAMPGVKAVVVDVAKNFAGVVADTRTRAHAALEKLQARYEGGSSIDDAGIEALVTARAGAGVVIRKRGDVDGGLRSGDIIEAAYRTPLAAHAHLEPLAALVSVTADKVEAWLPTQALNLEVNALKPVAGKREIVVHPMQMGGSFGRKAAQSAGLEAARLSEAAGKPVHVGWTRAEEMRHSFFRPPSHTLLRATLGADGRIAALEQSVASGDILFGVIKIPVADDAIKNLVGFDFGVLSGLFTPYKIANYRVHSQRVALPVPTGAWRGLGLMPNTFALESFVDELAASAQTDPLEFRLKHIPDSEDGERMKALLEDVATRSGWRDTPLEGRARGLAFCFHSDTAVAMVAEVSVQDGRIVVHRVTASVDAGLIVNPANATLQARGSVVMGLSSALIEKITVRDGAVEQSNFDDYPILRLSQTPPQIDIHFQSKLEQPLGMGEPVIGPVAAAVANAVFRLTGQRLRELPLKLEV